MKRQLVTTADGSSSLFVPELNEHFHSRFGALRESRHVFIQNGLLPLSHEKTSLDILEMGFGTGLNALLSLQFGLANGLTLRYEALEAFPLQPQEWAGLNYSDLDGMDGTQTWFQALHHAPWESWAPIHPHFQLKKRKLPFLDFIPDQPFDLIYFDAFAPTKQPELWTESLFRTLFQALRCEGTLVTYCAKGDVKRALRAAGFTVKALPGPPRKREMIRARKYS